MRLSQTAVNSQTLILPSLAPPIPDDRRMPFVPMDLAEQIEQEVRCYQEMGKMSEPWAALVAERLAELAAEVRFTGAETVDEFRARAAILESGKDS